MYNSSQYQTIYEDQSRISLYYRSLSFSANSYLTGGKTAYKKVKSG
jgi:hypothetical protein